MKNTSLTTSNTGWTRKSEFNKSNKNLLENEWSLIHFGQWLTIYIFWIEIKIKSFRSFFYQIYCIKTLKWKIKTRYIRVSCTSFCCTFQPVFNCLLHKTVADESNHLENFKALHFLALRIEYDISRVYVGAWEMLQFVLSLKNRHSETVTLNFVWANYFVNTVIR